MTEYKKMTLLKSIFLTNFLTIFVATLIVALLIYITLQNLFMDDISKKDKMIMQRINNNIEFFLSDTLDVLSYIEVNLQRKNDGDINKEIANYNEIDGYFENIEVLDKTGNIIYTLPTNQNQIGYTRSGEQYFKSLQSSTTYWSKPFISSTSGKATVVVATKKGEYILVGYLKLNYLNELTSQYLSKMGNNFEVSILDENGIYISSDDMLLVEGRKPTADINEIDAKAKSGGYKIISKNNVDYLMVSSRIDLTNWYIVVYDDYGVTFDSYHNMLYLFGMLFMASLFVYFIISYYRNTKITKNIDTFIKQTLKIAQGNYTTEFSDQKYLEFQNLASNFNTMTQTLKIRDDELLKLAYVDSLTGLGNRAYLYKESWKEELSLNQTCCLVYIDLDNFKNINDNYGHLFGDQLLIAIAKRIKKYAEIYSLAARIGGDEFVLIFGGDNCREDLTIKTKEILDSISQPYLVDGRFIYITASAGIAYSIMPGEINIHYLLKSADIALYEAKENGKSRYEIFTDELDEKISRRLLIELHLHEALNNRELSLVFQLQYSPQTNSIRGFEALIRWENNILGVVSPVEFIPIAEETGLIVEIGKWVLENACNYISQINQKLNSNFIISINVSPYEINQAGFLNNLLSSIAQSGIDKNLVEIEITENIFMDCANNVLDILEQISLNEIKISLDDFGTGYSSLSYLQKLPINTLKIDKSFINEMIKDPDSYQMIDTIILMGHNLGLQIIAEGVEKHDEVQALVKLSCDFIQGYYYSKPLEKEELEQYLKDQVQSKK